MSEIPGDMAWQALLDTTTELAPKLSRQALLRAYELEKMFQFEESRDAAIRELLKLADEYTAEGQP